MFYPTHVECELHRRGLRARGEVQEVARSFERNHNRLLSRRGRPEGHVNVCSSEEAFGLSDLSRVRCLNNQATQVPQHFHSLL